MTIEVADHRERILNARARGIDLYQRAYELCVNESDDLVIIEMVNALCCALVKLATLDGRVDMVLRVTIKKLIAVRDNRGRKSS